MAGVQEASFMYTIISSIHEGGGKMKRPDPPAVKMPEKVTRKKGAHDTVYIYKTVRAYRNDKGKPTSDEVAIGKLAADGESLIPNMRYFELHPTKARPIPPAQGCLSFGAAAVLAHLGDETGLSPLLRSIFPDLHSRIALTAVYMVLKGNVMCHIGDFCEENWVAESAVLDSARASELFFSIGFAGRKEFAEAWIAHVSEKDCIAYDVTSLSTYSGGIEDAEWGHNRDGEDLCQINLGMFFGEATRLPVHYITYQGSVLDKTHFELMMAEARALGIGAVRFVFDRGFVTAENIDAVADEHVSFVSALPAHLTEYKRLIDTAADIHSASNKVEDEGLYAHVASCSIGSTALSAHVFYSPSKAADEEYILWERIRRMEDELQRMSKARKLPRRYTDIFTIEGAGDGKELSFMRDAAKIDARIARLGYFVLITNDQELDSPSCLRIYREKDVIEKAFCGMKNHIDFKRMRTHTTPTTDGKLFCGFIALVLRSALATKIAKDVDTTGMTVPEVLGHLSKLKRITYADGSVSHTAVTKAQKAILKAVGITPEELLAM
jgi:transposase